MYDSNYSCKYTLGSIDDTPYREDLFNIFKIVEFDETQITQTLDTIYGKIKHDDAFIKILNNINLANKYSSDDLELVFVIMYSYDYMYLVHPCVCDLLNSGKISPENIK